MNKKQPQGEPSLKGTFVSVLLLGACIAAMWLAVFVLFIARS
ncbi:cytochrome c oxidase subunit 2A [Paenibacillus ginsengarvi]|uniref:Cytochrome c oxidase subunit 2A n=1 Tax=Paenibacillus ginsengarvi TaxID=400777 RepID=A0A3B0CKU7_9BACL|nr:cytochrome c oxidase subunit 2A [Paenibacillus ginsengarvi]RKN85471.1 cytochrome c oxidase subunit 2A [Paenibacillus ginsengarvi]